MKLFAIFGIFCLANAQRYISDMLDQINKARRQVNLRPICLSNRLTTIAQAYADKQASINMGGHFVGGTTPQQRAHGFWRVRENLFEGYGSAGSGQSFIAIRETLRDRGQRGTILDHDITHVGIGKSATTDQHGQPYFYWVQLFAQTGEPCHEGNIIDVRHGPSLPEYVAPPEKEITIKQIYDEPVPGEGRVEIVEKNRKTYLDTIPRVVDGSRNDYPNESAAFGMELNRPVITKFESGYKNRNPQTSKQRIEKRYNTDDYFMADDHLGTKFNPNAANFIPKYPEPREEEPLPSYNQHFW